MSRTKPLMGNANSIHTGLGTCTTAIHCTPVGRVGVGRDMRLLHNCGIAMSEVDTLVQ
jgi:hypothetical protein